MSEATNVLIPKLATAPIPLAEPEQAAREVAALLVIGSHAISTNFVPRFEAALGEISEATRINLMLEPIMHGAAYVRFKARQIAADGTQAGVFAAYLYLKTLFYISLAFDVAPAPRVDREEWEIPRVTFVAPEGYERLREQYEFWYTVRNEQYMTARSRLGVQFLRYLYGETEVVRLAIHEFVRRSFADDHVAPPKNELATYSAENCAVIESIARWLRRV